MRSSKPPGRRWPPRRPPLVPSGSSMSPVTSTPSAGRGPWSASFLNDAARSERPLVVPNPLPPSPSPASPSPPASATPSVGTPDTDSTAPLALFDRVGNARRALLRDVVRRDRGSNGAAHPVAVGRVLDGSDRGFGDALSPPGSRPAADPGSRQSR